MKSSSKKLIRVIKVCLDVAWYANFVLATVAFSFLIYTFFSSNSEEYQETSSYVRTGRYYLKADISGNTDDVRNAVLRTNIAYLSYEIKSTPLVKFFAFFILLAFELLAFSLISHLRKFFTNLDRGLLFTGQNVEVLKRCALFALLILPLQLLIYLLEQYYLTSNFPASYRFSVESSLNFEILIICSILYIAAEIFNYGLELKKENEEFV